MSHFLQARRYCPEWFIILSTNCKCETYLIFPFLHDLKANVNAPMNIAFRWISRISQKRLNLKALLLLFKAQWHNWEYNRLINCIRESIWWRCGKMYMMKIINGWRLCCTVVIVFQEDSGLGFRTFLKNCNKFVWWLIGSTLTSSTHY